MSYLKGGKKTEGTGGERENGRYANNNKFCTWGKINFENLICIYK